jgi:hypothetical protein
VRVFAVLVIEVVVAVEVVVVAAAAVVVMMIPLVVPFPAVVMPFGWRAGRGTGRRGSAAR